MKKNLKEIGGVVLFGIVFVPGFAWAGSAILTWSPNAEPDLAGYKVYYGTSPRSGNDPRVCGLCGYTNSASVLGAVTSYSLNNLTDGQTYYFSVSAFDFSNNESAFSVQVSKFMQASVSQTPVASPSSIVIPSSSGGGSSGGGYSSNIGGAIIYHPSNSIVSTTTAALNSGSGSGGSGVVSSIGVVDVKRYLRPGVSGDDVKKVQQFLAAQNFLQSFQVSGKYDEATKKAVEKFQVVNKIAVPGDEGFGNIGIKTRKVIKERTSIVFGNNLSQERIAQIRAQIAVLQKALREILVKYQKILQANKL